MAMTSTRRLFALLVSMLLPSCKAFLLTKHPPAFSMRQPHPALFSTSEETQEMAERVENGASASTVAVNNDDDNHDKEPVLSELDARVLQSMLQDDTKLDLKQEENMKRLLERGVAPKTAPDVSKQKPDQDEDSQFESETLKKLSNTKLWKALKRKGSDLIESAGIYIMNRIERDTKLALSVGLFAWERAVRDAGRALPASGQSGAAVGRAMRKAVRQLGSSSSFDEMQALEREQQQKRRLEDVENLYEEFNTPMDEIRSVTQSIRDILSGDSTSSSASSGVRRLRTVSAAGLGTKNAERQRRAFNRRKKTKLRQEKEFLNVGRTAGSLIDTGFELKRELRAESSLPGYRSEKARKAIAAGAAQTARVLEAAKRDGWSRALFGTAEVRDETIREMVGSTDIEEVESVATDETISQLLEEEYLIVDRIQLCIDDPAETWLTPESLMENEYEIDDDSLREVVTAMICARDDLEVDGERTAVNEDLTLEEMIDRMRVVKNTVDMIVSLAASSVSFTAGENLRNVLYGPEARDGKGVSLLNLDEIESSVAAAVDAVEEAKYFVEEVPTKRKRSIFEILFEEKPTESGLDDDISNEGVTNDKISSSDPPHQWDSTAVAKVVVDSTEPSFWAGAAASRPRFPEVIVSDFEKVGHATESQSGSESEDVGVRLTTAEVVSDEDFDRAVNWAKATTTLPEDGGETEEKKEDSLFTMALLRSLDVVLFVAEKVLLAVPTVVQTGTVAAQRAVQAGRGGLGYFGWKKMKNAANGAKRY